MGLQMTVRERVVVLVAGLGALGGFIAGAAGALLAVAILTPSAPVTTWDKLSMVLGYGTVSAISGAVLGTGLAFAILRRVRLGRIFAFGTAGAALGLTYGFLGGPWAWHHLPWLGIGGLAAGALVARLLGRESGEGGVEARLASWVLTRTADAAPRELGPPPAAEVCRAPSTGASTLHAMPPAIPNHHRSAR